MKTHRLIKDNPAQAEVEAIILQAVDDGWPPSIAAAYIQDRYEEDPCTRRRGCRHCAANYALERLLSFILAGDAWPLIQ